MTFHNSFPEWGHMIILYNLLSIDYSACEEVANNNISGFGMSSFSDKVKYKDFDILDTSLGRMVPNCDKSL